jgi:hypothetical protein
VRPIGEDFGEPQFAQGGGDVELNDPQLAEAAALDARHHVNVAYSQIQRRGLLERTLDRLIGALDFEDNYSMGRRRGTTTGRRVEELVLCVCNRLQPLFRLAAFGLLFLCVYGILAALGYLREIADAVSRAKS